MHKIAMPRGAQYIIGKLNSKGYEAYIVGGCVRDCLLGKQPNDWDITTNATPEQVKALFRRTVDTGIRHGTVTVLVEKQYSTDNIDDVSHTDYAYEVTTYRVDGMYEDHRRPTSVTFSKSLTEDLKRRDFTINAMAYNDTDGLVDIFGGQEDLSEGVIRCVGEPSERFDEDALRILRAVRFAAQLGFRIDEKTAQAMEQQARFLSDISAERIQVELTKLICSDHPELLRDAYLLGITKVILPEFDVMMETEQNNPYHIYSVGEHTIRVIQNVPNQPVLRYAALLHDVGKPASRTTGPDGRDHFYGHPQESAQLAHRILRRLKLDNHTISAVERLVLYHDYGISGNQTGMRAFRRFLGSLGDSNFADFLVLRKADMAGQSDYRMEQRSQRIAALEAMYDEVIRENQCFKLSDLAIGGKDLIALGMKPGPDIGGVLKVLFEHVLDVPEDNDKEVLLVLAKKFI
ncbi:MAG: CCA tRNA nucleotidyltransferase [Eubacteriales bacterium]|nr:CCA tRNA nucleotidyltransferase [Eubacteriales bacterium]